MRVTFRASAPVTMTHRPCQADILWGDQPTPPPPVAREYTHPPDPWYKVWPPTGRAEEAQTRRIKQALFIVGEKYVQLDPRRSRFTYTRCTLVGTVVLDEDAKDWSRWNGVAYRPYDAMDAASSVLLVLRCALATVYEVRPERGSISDLPLPGLAISLREVAR